MVAELLTWQATHTHPLAEHFPLPLLTHALTGVEVAQKLAVYKPRAATASGGTRPLPGQCTPKIGLHCSPGLLHASFHIK